VSESRSKSRFLTVCSSLTAAPHSCITMSVESAKHMFADLDSYKADTRDNGISAYMLERRRFYTDEAWEDLHSTLARSTWLYIGNLSFYTTEEQMLELFGRCGVVKRLVMGLNKVDKTPCGFAFVQYHNHADALTCQRFIAGTCLDERPIKADLDPGFEEGRQYGRSRKSGGQRRDDFRQSFDPGRGGWAPPPQQDIFPLYADHPVGTTTVSVHGGAANTATSSTAEARARAAHRSDADHSRSRSREPQRARSRSKRSRSRSPRTRYSRSRSRSRSRDKERERERSSSRSSSPRRRRSRSPSSDED